MSAEYLASRADSADAHARTWALIPWLVNGRADPAQRAAAEAHLADGRPTVEVDPANLAGREANLSPVAFLRHDLGTDARRAAAVAAVRRRPGPRPAG